MDHHRSHAELLQSHGLRPTRQRVAVLATLRAVTNHPTAEELHRTIVGTDGDLSLATVYNTLQALSDVGLCRRMATSGYAHRYCAGTHEHVHLRDGATGRIVDVPTELSDRLLASVPRELLDEIARRVGGEIDGVSIQLVGSVPVPRGAVASGDALTHVAPAPGSRSTARRGAGNPGPEES